MSYIGSTPANKLVTSSDMEDGIVTTAKIANDAATADKIANAVNSAITANTAKTGISSAQTSAITANTSKTTNATHSGEVTGSGALTIAGNVVDEANLKVSNSPTNGYFLTAQSGNTGGMTWVAPPGGGKILQVSNFVQASATQTISSSSYTDLTDLSIAITPSASSSKIMLTTNISSYLTGDEGYGMQFLKGSSSIYANRQTYAIYNGTSSLYSNSIFSFIDSPSTTSAITYKVQVRTHQAAATDFNIGTFSTFYLIEIGA